MKDSLLRLKLDGWCVLDSIIPADQVSAIRESIIATTAKHRNPNAPPHIGHVSGIINHDQSIAPYLADERLMTLLKAVLGAHVRISMTTGTINESGNSRGDWHADWPFNQRNAGHFPAPYPDIVAHITTIWMLVPFTVESGGTLVISGSHRMDNNPTGDNGVDPTAPYSTEINAIGAAGSVLVMDSRLWHATAPNTTSDPRVAIVIRYAPWWLDLKPLMPDSVERDLLHQATGKGDNQVPSMPQGVFDTLPEAVKPLYAHWIK